MPQSPSPSPATSPTRRPGLLAGWNAGIVVLLVASAAGAVLLLWLDERRRAPAAGAEGKAAFGYEIEPFARIDPATIRYRPVLRIDTGLEKATAVAVGPGDAVYAGGDRRVRRFARDGRAEGEVACGDTPMCLAVGADGAVFVGLENRIEVRAPDGALRREWRVGTERARLTSIAVAAGVVYAADAGKRAVWVFTEAGEPVRCIDDADPAKKLPSFVVPSPYFDVAVPGDGRLRVVNPGRHWVGTFTADGELDCIWGEASFRLEGFSGCCNPSHLAPLPDGGFVTSEKGIVRIKVHDAAGRFACVIAGPEALGEEPCARDVAADSTGRVWVLDPPTRSLRGFEKKEGG